MFYRFYIELNKPGSFAARESILHDQDNPYWQANLRAEHFPDFNPVFGDVIFSDESSPVDFVNDGFAIGGLGLLIGKRALDVLRTFNLPPYRVYALTAVHKGRKLIDQYFWLQVLTVPYADWVDFTQSEFYLKSQFEMDPDVKGERCMVASAGHFDSITEKLGENDQELWIEKLVLNRQYSILNCDLFYLEHLDGVRQNYPVISARLKTSFEQNELVGFEVRPMPGLRIV